MWKKCFKNIMILLVITSITVMPYLNLGTIPKASAEWSPNSNDAQNINDIEGYITKIGKVIMTTPGCKKIFKKGGVKELFKDIMGISTKKDDPDEAERESELAGQEAAQEAEAVLVMNKTGNYYESKASYSVEKVDTSTADINKNTGCLNGVGKMIIKLVLQKLVKSTIDWINSGYDGNPTFVTNTGEFFEDIGKSAVLKFGLEIQDPVLFPFGKDFMRNQVSAIKDNFANNAQYSLDKFMADTNTGYTPIDFNNDFSKGGWGAWDAMTQIPGNNPLGFNLMAANELRNRINTQGQTGKDDIARGGGFLSQEICTDPAGVTRQENDAALADPEGEARICNNWKYVTPGSVISEKAMSVTHYPEDALLSGQDLNDAIAALMDAFINSLTGKIQSDSGLAGLSSYNSSHTDYLDIGINNLDTQVEKDFPSNLSSSFLQENPGFNIRTDITQALIDDQRTYIQKLQEQNKQLSSTCNSSNPNCGHNLNGSPYTGAYGLIPTIYQLDYCIPGPHPGWEDEARTNLEARENNTKFIMDLDGMSDEEITKFLNNDAGNVADALNLASGLDPSGSASLNVSLINSNESSDEKVEAYYYKSIVNLIGLNVRTDVNIATFSQVMKLLNSIFDRYKKVNKNIFNQNRVPIVTKDSETEYNKLDEYYSIMEGNATNISLLKSIIIRLGEIKNAVETLNNRLALPASDPNHIDQTTYEANLKQWVNAFARLSANMVSGNDIAQADKTLKNFQDKEKYVYNDLLKGPQGCENDLQGIKTLGLEMRYGKRYSYPSDKPLLYDYNNFPYYSDPGTPLPDPLNFGKSFTNFQTVYYNTVYGLKWVATYGSGYPGGGGNQFAVNNQNNNTYADTGNLHLSDICYKITQDLRDLGQNVYEDCTNGIGPNFIHITDLVNAPQQRWDPTWPDGIDAFEKAIGIY